MKKQLELDKTIAVLGKKGSGKTNLLANLIQSCVKMCPTYVFDAVGNYSLGGEFYRKEFVILDDRKLTPEQLHTNNVFVKRIRNETNWIAFNNDILSLYQDNKHSTHCYIIYDELYLNVDRYNMDSEKNQAFKEMLIAGRNYGIGIIASAQRSGIMNKTFFSQCSQIYCYRLFETNDLKAVEDYFDIEKVKNLKDYHFLGYFPDIEIKNKEFSPIPYVGNNKI